MSSTLKIKDKARSFSNINIAPFRKEIRKTKPHKHNNYFEIIYLSKGSGTHFIDYKKYTVKTPVIFFVRKEQVHHWELLTKPQGYVLILKKAFIDKSLDSELKALLTKVSSISCLQVKDAGTIDQLFRLLDKENNNTNINSSPITEGLLKALLAKVIQIAKPSDRKTKIKAGLFQAFRELLSQSTELRNHVAHYAERLNTTPQNLNAACRRSVNQPATEVLAGHIISEAKRLLIYTGKSVSEISFTLDFNDPSHFVKYFKRHTGYTPTVFRKLQN